MRHSRILHGRAKSQQDLAPRVLDVLFKRWRPGWLLPAGASNTPKVHFLADGIAQDGSNLETAFRNTGPVEANLPPAGVAEHW